MQNADRKAAIAEYKKRKAVAGIFAVRCAATGQTWVGRALDMDSIQTRLWFGLRTKGNIHRPLQATWDAHGADSFSFEALETLKDEEIAYVRDGILKDRLAFWKAELSAETV